MSNACFAARRGRHKAFPYISTRVIVHRLLYRLHFQTGVPPLLAPTFLFFSPVQDATCSVAREAYADNARAHINRGLQPRVSLPPAFFEKPPFAYTLALSLLLSHSVCLPLSCSLSLCSILARLATARTPARTTAGGELLLFRPARDAHVGDSGSEQRVSEPSVEEWYLGRMLQQPLAVLVISEVRRNRAHRMRV